jgi:hypothetical protein
MVEFVFSARGHGNVVAKHGTTLEFTRETHLSLRGDCIVAVGSDVGCMQLPGELKTALRRDDTVLTIVIECGGVSDVVRARGSGKLGLTHPSDMVVRKSGFVCPRTLGVHADKAACDLSRGLVEKLRGGGPVRVHLKVEFDK